MTTQNPSDDLNRLLAILPKSLQSALASLPCDELLEIVLDLGRPPQARLPGRAIDLGDAPVDRAGLHAIVERLGDFGEDNRAGIEGTLHRISAIRNRRGEIVGLTLRVGRAMAGTIELLRDLIEDGRSLLLLGRPGVGKTTKLREIARVLADDLHKRVIVIDTSNEIAGDGDIPHRAIGSARRMQVAHPARQHAVMIEAVENHMPEVIVIDEIGTAAEAEAARTIAERGVQLIGTAHGNTLENLVRNPTLADLIGGVQTVTLGDEEARQRRSRKTVSERKAPPTFDIVVEMRDYDEVIVHTDTAEAVDRLLRGQPVAGLRRTPDSESTVPVTEPARECQSVRAEPATLPLHEIRGAVRIHPYALGRDLVERVIRDLRLDAVVTNKPDRAHLIIAPRTRAGEPRLQRIAQAHDLPVHVLKRNTTAQLRRLLQKVFNQMAGADEDEAAIAVRDAERAIRKALEEGVAVALPPAPPAIRQLQHRIAIRHHVMAESVGQEPRRHLVITPHAFAGLPEEVH